MLILGTKGRNGCLFTKISFLPLEVQVKSVNHMLEDLYNNTYLAMLSEVVEWFNTIYCYIFVNGHTFLPSVQNRIIKFSPKSV